MIHDVDESLRALVARDALNGSGVEVAFDAPTKDWVARRNAPAVNLYLYDIREDLSRRDTAWVDVRNGEGRVTERRLPPRRYRLSYLVTAWTTRPEDEHRLLSALLSGFVRHEFFPAELLKGTLEGEETPILVTVALPPEDDRKIADTWSAIGGELKPSLDVVVTAPMDIARSIEAGPPVIEAPRLDVVRSDPSGPVKGQAHTGGRSSRAGQSAGGSTVSSDQDTPRPSATAPTAVRTKATDGRGDDEARTESEAEAESDTDLPDETLTAGGRAAPGRRIRVRGMPRR